MTNDSLLYRFCYIYFFADRFLCMYFILSDNTKLFLTHNKPFLGCGTCISKQGSKQIENAHTIQR